MNKISDNLAAFALEVFAGHAHAHSAPLSKAATQACHEKEKSQACHYEGGHADLYIGTCQYVSDENLICVRNQPIQKIDADEALSKEWHQKP